MAGAWCDKASRIAWAGGNTVTKHLPKRNESGFTLIELLIAMAIALAVMGGLFLNFTAQNSEFSYQNRRIDAAQDMEFALKFVSDDLRSSLRSLSGAPTGNPVENGAFAGTGATTSLTFWVWDEDAANADGLPVSRAKRKYFFDAANETLCYDRQISNAGMTADTNDNAETAGGSCNSNQAILTNVTYFKVFNDNVSVGSRASFADIPPPMAPMTVFYPDDASIVAIQGYTVLIEMAVQAGYKQGRMTDVLGNNHAGTADQRKRIWRYVQVYPMAVVD